MIRPLPAESITGQGAAALPLKVLLAVAKGYQPRPAGDVINVPAVAAALAGGAENAATILEARVWAPHWTPDDAGEYLLTSSFLGLDAPAAIDESWSTYDIVHCVGDVGGTSDGDPLLFMGYGSLMIASGRLRDALVRARTRLLILEEQNESVYASMPSARMAEFIVSSGGPPVLVVAAARLADGRQYFADLYSAILRNRPLDEATQAKKFDLEVLLVHPQNGLGILQFDRLIGQLGKKLADYSSLVTNLLSGVRRLDRERAGGPGLAADAEALGRLYESIRAERLALDDLVSRLDQIDDSALVLARIAAGVSVIDRDIGLHRGEGPLHTRFDTLEYMIDQARRERGPWPEEWLPEPEFETIPVLLRGVPSGEESTEVTVFFGTNRSKVAGGKYYGKGRDAMHYGRCLVSVPTDRRIGTIPRPSIWTLYKANPKKHFILQKVSEIRRDGFITDLREYINACSDRQALVFVHGFNVDFVSAVLRTAQIAADLNFAGAPILFSWPSKGSLSPLAYTHDETQARWTLPDLRAFLELIVAQSGATTIHLLAHSMGNRALTEALMQMAAAMKKRSRAIFNELVLTAPDIDSDTFTRDIAPAILRTARRVTLYASSNDAALAFSKTVHGYDRAGESGDNIVLVPGIDTIDVSSVDTNLIGHFYYGDNRSVLSDMFNVIRGQAATSRFGLRKRMKQHRQYWAFQP